MKKFSMILLFSSIALSNLSYAETSYSSLFSMGGGANITFEKDSKNKDSSIYNSIEFLLFNSYQNGFMFGGELSFSRSEPIVPSSKRTNLPNRDMFNNNISVLFGFSPLDYLAFSTGFGYSHGSYFKKLSRKEAALVSSFHVPFVILGKYEFSKDFFLFHKIHYNFGDRDESFDGGKREIVNKNFMDSIRHEVKFDIGLAWGSFPYIGLFVNYYSTPYKDLTRTNSLSFGLKLGSLDSSKI